MTMPDSTAKVTKRQYAGAENGSQPGGVALEVQAAVQLSTSMAKLADVMAAEQKRHAEFNQAIHPFNIPVNTIALSGGAGTLNQPNLYSPQMGNFWDVRRIQVTGITAGVVTVYLNAVGAEVLAVLVSTGANTPAPQYFGSGQILLGASDGLVWSATGITGTPLVSVSGIEIAAEWIGDYLL